MYDVEGWITHWIAMWGYWAVFFGVMIESAGVPLPGETIVAIASTMAAKGSLQVAWLYPLVVSGAVIGDNAGYALGRWGGKPLLKRIGRLWGLDGDRIEEASATFRRYGGRAVFFGRFVSLLRMLAGPIAGTTGMPWPRFLLFNALGAIAWAGVVVTLGYTLGPRLMDLLHRYHALGLVLVLGVLTWLLVKTVRSHR